MVDVLINLPPILKHLYFILISPKPFDMRNKFQNLTFFKFFERLSLKAENVIHDESELVCDGFAHQRWKLFEKRAQLLKFLDIVKKFFLRFRGQNFIFGSNQVNYWLLFIFFGILLRTQDVSEKNSMKFIELFSQTLLKIFNSTTPQHFGITFEYFLLKADVNRSLWYFRRLHESGKIVGSQAGRAERLSGICGDSDSFQWNFRLSNLYHLLLFFLEVHLHLRNYNLIEISKTKHYKSCNFPFFHLHPFASCILKIPE